jgi:TusA-related sulfurtransferase
VNPESDMDKVKPDEVLDCYGLLCPMPIIKTAQMIKTMQAGQVLEVVSTDKGIKEDMPSWCRQTGQEFLGFVEEEGVFRAFVKKIKE